jgi:hypothetical protein
MVVMVLPPHHLIHLNIFFLPEWRVYGDSTRFGHEWFFFSFSFSFSFFLGLCVDHTKNIPTLQLIFFFGFNPSSLICNFFNLHWLFLIWFYFWFLLWSFDFWNLFLDLVLFFELLFVLF